MEETISLRELFLTLKKRLSLILIITIIAVMASGIISYFILTPIYQSSTQLLVNQSKNEQAMYNYSEVQTNLQLINTYNVIIKSPAILDLVVKDLDLDMTGVQLSEKITVQSAQNSQVVNVSVQDPSPGIAADIANKTAEIFQNEIVKIMNVDNVSILAKATVSESQSPIKPQPLLNIAIALVVGLMAGVGLAFLLEYLDNTIKTENDIEKVLGLPVLGVITVIEEQGDQSARADRKSRLRGETVGS
ncbi:Wzz/FepE/Etk N-terminal domain-containing protein [Bacillus sp. DTU_2020_1000418_1_SI_GHA_SEK_038]|uniref:YveK family protein n=1 Tax=Bacillus sp. DTU_2020_1000418_1_SI_GHA_SEK_038 TaxID=3077585 RepID=UPI0028E324BC|nr:Wzz/FepE/Etk N-terminal domain-containing protein [Bacillus sp. DTU_2020_1000418_1_SI_GHA_SEK_038]WNS77669.1 Wzz/FepE/Etk N-terminal domain-containing protein [Bacillus sp. DTU_2020_1000418_1_SI_GHA_SEK_038]